MNLTKQFTFSIILILSFNIGAHGQWTSIAAYPSTETDGQFSFTIGNDAYVGGGIADNQMYHYDAAMNTWSRMADVPSPGNTLAWAAAFSVNGKAYVVGGSYATASDLTDALWEYDPAMDKWTQKAGLITGPRDGCFSFAIGGKGYVGGGFDGQYVHSDFYEYAPATDQWTQLMNYPGGPVIFAVAFVIDDKAYVGTGGQGSAEIDDIWQFDPATGMWTQMADFPGDLRQAAVGFAINGQGYIGAGMSQYSIERKDFWRYDPGTNTWTDLQADFAGENIAWSTAFVVDNSAYVGSGVSIPKFDFYNSFYKYTAPSTGIAEPSKGRVFSMYPMPATDVLNISAGKGEKIQSLVIADYCGKEVLRMDNEAKQSIQLQVGGLAKGAYVVKLQTESGCGSQLFIKD